jgi:hypothetical protein
MSFFNKGANDKAQNKGPADPNKFPSDKAKKDYEAGYKKDQQQKKK